MDGTPFGRYRPIEMLGRGGMGEVWRAWDTETKRTVAIKVLPPYLADDNEFVQRFRREAEAAAQLNSPHVIPIHHYGEIDGRLYVDMRLIDGRDLGALLAEGPLEPARAVRIIDQVAKALHAAHKVGLIHRDIKPSNILLDDDDFAYLIDFGIARAADETRITKSGNTIGTFAYIAPERLDSQTEEDARTDIYSLTCVLYEALTGKPPFPGSTAAQLIAAHLNTAPPRPSVTQPDVPPQVDEVIATGMAKDPNQRYATTVELADAARDAITEPVLRLTPSPPSLPATERAPLPPTERAGSRVTAQPPTVDVQSLAPAKPDPQSAPLIPTRGSGLSRRTTIAVIVGAAALVAVIALAAMLSVNVGRRSSDATGNSNSNPPQSTPASSAISTTSVPQASGSGTAALPPFKPSSNVGGNCQYPPSPDPAAKSVKPPFTGKIPTDPAEVSATMVTNHGNIGLMLANNQSPCTVNNFASLIGQRYFDNTNCHRLTTSPMLSVLQCGDPKGDGTGGPGYQFANEYPTDQYSPNDPKLQEPVLYPRGTLAMANAGPNTNGSQFFMVYKDSQLPPQYTVFGTIDQTGLATLDKVAATGVAGGGEDGTPATEVTIKSIWLD